MSTDFLLASWDTHPVVHQPGRPCCRLRSALSGRRPPLPLLRRKSAQALPLAGERPRRFQDSGKCVAMTLPARPHRRSVPVLVSQCGCEMRIIVFITDASRVRYILAHLGKPAGRATGRSWRLAIRVGSSGAGVARRFSNVAPLPAS